MRYRTVANIAPSAIAPTRKYQSPGTPTRKMAILPSTKISPPTLPPTLICDRLISGRGVSAICDVTARRLCGNYYALVCVFPDRGTPMLTFILWCILFVICWPLALFALLMYPLVWLLLLPFRIVGIAVEGVETGVGGGHVTRKTAGGARQGVVQRAGIF